MSINPEIVGRVYPSENTYVVGREKIREFARAVHAENPLHHIVAGDELRTEVHVDSVRVMGAGAMLTTREEIVDAQGEPVTTCISSLLVRAEEEN